MITHARGRLYENLILVALGTGMRGGEMLGLTWDDVDFRRREISINKTLVHMKQSTQKQHVQLKERQMTRIGKSCIYWKGWKTYRRAHLPSGFELD